MIDIRNNAKWQGHQTNTTLIIITSEVRSKKGGCIPDSRGISATVYVNDRYKEQRKVAGTPNKYNTYLIITSEVRCKKGGCLPNSRGISATVYVNDRYKEQRKVAGILIKQIQHLLL